LASTSVKHCFVFLTQWHWPLVAAAPRLIEAIIGA
jgi:hypothetical protein